jgi:hypothetical protein
MKSIPPKLSQESLEKAKNDFISQPSKASSSNSYPWESSDVRDDVYKTFNIRLKESDYLKLKYIAEHSKDSMHSICIEPIEETIKTKLSNML